MLTFEELCKDVSKIIAELITQKNQMVSMDKKYCEIIVKNNNNKIAFLCNQHLIEMEINEWTTPRKF